jgi:hypothetical protein
MRNLIVNADDCNLTAGVTRAVLECHENGIVSSTSWMVNLPVDSEWVGRVGQSGIGIGLHLNVTSGRPISDPEKIRSLLKEDGAFKRKDDYVRTPPDPGELAAEYTDQILFFEKLFGRLPTHFDTHHQMHDFPVFMQAIAHVARTHRRPLRRSSLMREPEFERQYPGLVTTQTLWGDLAPHAFWTDEKLEKVLSGLLPGTAEIMCHPGIWDEELQRVTSMTVTREKEYALFSSPHLKKMIDKHKIRLINFSQLEGDRPL